jgi:hypothetical protein
MTQFLAEKSLIINFIRFLGSMLQFTMKRRPCRTLSIATLQHGEARLGSVPDGGEAYLIL